MNKLLQEIRDENMHFWGFAGINVMYFSIWCIIAWYLTLWMEEVANIDSIYAGIIFSIMAASSLVLQPFFGIISDKLVFKKHLILTISILGVFIGPYFQYLFLDLLSINTFFTITLTGIYLGFILHGGSAVVEQYIQRAALANKYGWLCSCYVININCRKIIYLATICNILGLFYLRINHDFNSYF